MNVRSIQERRKAVRMGQPVSTLLDHSRKSYAFLFLLTNSMSALHYAGLCLLVSSFLIYLLIHKTFSSTSWRISIFQETLMPLGVVFTYQAV